MDALGLHVSMRRKGGLHMRREAFFPESVYILPLLIAPHYSTVDDNTPTQQDWRDERWALVGAGQRQGGRILRHHI